MYEDCIALLRQVQWLLHARWLTVRTNARHKQSKAEMRLANAKSESLQHRGQDGLFSLVITWLALRAHVLVACLDINTETVTLVSFRRKKLRHSNIAISYCGIPRKLRIRCLTLP